MYKSAGKSRIALIRKILVSAYHMLKRREMFHWADDELYSRKPKNFTVKWKKSKVLLGRKEKQHESA